MAVADFPKTQEDKNTYYLAARTRIVARQVILGITTPNKDLLNGLLDDANGWIDVNTKHRSTDADSTAIQRREIELIGLVEKQLTIIYNDIPTSALNIDDYTVFRFNAGTSGHAHILPQTTPANLTLEDNHHLGHKLRIKNPLTPESDAMPHGNHAKMWLAVSPTKVADADIKWDPNPKIATTRFHSQSFTVEQVGQFAAYMTRYENAQGEQGDPSEVLWVPIW